MMKNNNTRVICPNCGTSFCIPEHESLSVGIAIGKDSGLGDIYLKPETKEEKRKRILEESGVSVPNPLTNESTEEDSVVRQIMENGYVANPHLHRRYVMAHLFKMLETGFDKALKERGYGYQFRVLLSENNGEYKGEINALAAEERQHDPDLEIRRKFFSLDCIREIMNDYYSDVIGRCNEKYVEKIQRLTDAMQYVEEADTYAKMKKAVLKVLNCNCRASADSEMSEAFINAYKGAGAYYTLDNMIKFHGCHINGLDMYGSLDVLKKKVDDCNGQYYKLLGFLKTVVKENNFDFKARMKELKED